MSGSIASFRLMAVTRASNHGSQRLNYSSFYNNVLVKSLVEYNVQQQQEENNEIRHEVFCAGLVSCICITKKCCNYCLPRFILMYHASLWKPVKRIFKIYWGSFIYWEEWSNTKYFNTSCILLWGNCLWTIKIVELYVISTIKHLGSKWFL